MNNAKHRVSRVGTNFNYVKRQSIGGTLDDKQKVPVISQRNNSFRFHAVERRASWRADWPSNVEKKEREKREKKWGKRGTEKKYTKIGNAAKWSAACVRMDVARIVPGRETTVAPGTANPFSRPAVRGRFLVRMRYGSPRVADSYVDVDNRC